MFSPSKGVYWLINCSVSTKKNVKTLMHTSFCVSINEFMWQFYQHIKKLEPCPVILDINKILLTLEASKSGERMYFLVELWKLPYIDTHRDFLGQQCRPCLKNCHFFHFQEPINKTSSIQSFESAGNYTICIENNLEIVYSDWKFIQSGS